MSNYVQTTFFAPKDALLTGNPLKLIKGADVDPEFAAIAVAIATKFDSSSISSAPVGFADGTAAAPGITFASQTNMGFFRAGNNDLGITVAGVKVVDLQAAAITAFGSAVAGVANLAATNTSTTATQDVEATLTAGSSVALLYVANQNRATAVVTSGPTTAQAVLYTSGAIPLVFGTNGINRGQITGAGSWIIPATSAAADTFTITGPASQYALTLNGAAGAGTSFGLRVLAGTNSSDNGVFVRNAANTATFLNIVGDGSGTLGPSATLGLQWNTSGNITIPTPSSGAPLTINGTSGGAAYFTASNNSNAHSTADIANSSAGTAGAASYRISNSTHTMELGITSTGFSGAWVTNMPAGESAYLVVGSTTPLGFGIGNNVQFLLTSAGRLQGLGPVAAVMVDMTPDTSTFTGTFKDTTNAGATGTVRWARSGNFVTITFPVVTFTSQNTDFFMTGLPAAIQPLRLQHVALATSSGENNNAVTTTALSARLNVSGQIDFFITGGQNLWTGSGVKGFLAVNSITYSLA